MEIDPVNRRTSTAAAWDGASRPFSGADLIDPTCPRAEPRVPLSRTSSLPKVLHLRRKARERGAYPLWRLICQETGESSDYSHLLLVKQWGGSLMGGAGSMRHGARPPRWASTDFRRSMRPFINWISRYHRLLGF